jgi:hypothetical protein
MKLQMGQVIWSITYTKLEMLARAKHSRLLGPFLSYEEIKVL